MWEKKYLLIGGPSLKPKNLRFEDQIEPFPYSFQPVTVGKILAG
jgi:hypothetical protein